MNPHLQNENGKIKRHNLSKALRLLLGKSTCSIWTLHHKSNWHCWQHAMTLYGLSQLVFTTPISRSCYYPHLICSWHYVKERQRDRNGETKRHGGGKEWGVGVGERERGRERGGKAVIKLLKMKRLDNIENLF